MLRKIILQAMFVLALATFAVALIVFSTTTVSAQAAGNRITGGTPQPPRPPRIEELLNSLRLSDQQAIVVQNTLNAERGAMRAIEESVRPQRDAIHVETRKKLASVLTPDQLQRYDDWREAHRPPRPEDAGERPPNLPANNRRNATQ